MMAKTLNEPKLCLKEEWAKSCERLIKLLLLQVDLHATESIGWFHFLLSLSLCHVYLAINGIEKIIRMQKSNTAHCKHKGYRTIWKENVTKLASLVIFLSQCTICNFPGLCWFIEKALSRSKKRSLGEGLGFKYRDTPSLRQPQRANGSNFRKLSNHWPNNHKELKGQCPDRVYKYITEIHISAGYIQWTGLIITYRKERMPLTLGMSLQGQEELLWWSMDKLPFFSTKTCTRTTASNVCLSWNHRIDLGQLMGGRHLTSSVPVTDKFSKLKYYPDASCPHKFV